MGKPFSHTMPFGVNTPVDVLSKADRQLINFRPQIGGAKPPAGQKDMFIKLANKGNRKFKDRFTNEKDAPFGIDSSITPLGTSSMNKEVKVSCFSQRIRGSDYLPSKMLVVYQRATLGLSFLRLMS